MDLNAKYRQQFYQEQNIQLRKQIREVDLLLAQSYKKEEESNSNSCVFLVLGCPSSGKTSLLQYFIHYKELYSSHWMVRKGGEGPKGV